MITRVFIFLCLVGSAWCDAYFPPSCARCTTGDLIPKLPQATGPVDSGSNRPYAWAIEAMILTKAAFEIVSPPIVGRICGVVGTCLYEAASLCHKDISSTLRAGVKLPSVVGEDSLTDAIDGAGYWALYRLFGDTGFFSVVHNHYEAFSGNSIRHLVPAMERAVRSSHSSPRRFFFKHSSREDAVAAGALACERVIRKYSADGFTPRGDHKGVNPSSYRPRNTAQTIAGLTDCPNLEVPGVWQPICVPNNDRAYATKDCTPQTFLTDWAGRYTTFALKGGDETSGRELVPPPPSHGSSEYGRQADEVLKISGKLGDREKLLAEYWADGPDTTMPAGHFWRIAADAAKYEGLSQTETAKLLFLVGVALNDAGVASWRCKTTFDFSRPLQMIQCSGIKRLRRAWLGPYKGTGLINVRNWRPYQRTTFFTPFFAAYTSGHSTFSAAGAEALKLFFGDDRYRGPSCDIVREGESLFEPRSDIYPGVSNVPNRGPGTPGYAPAEDTFFCWDTWTGAAEQSGMSRLYGGIHVSADNDNGQTLGRRVARTVYAKAKRLF